MFDKLLAIFGWPVHDWIVASLKHGEHGLIGGTVAEYRAMVGEAAIAWPA